MKVNISQLRQWFGFTRRERRASLMLITLIIIMVCVRFLIPDNKAIVNYIQIEKELIESDSLMPIFTELVVTSNVQNRASVTKLEIIDINSCDSTELLSLPGIGQVLSARIVRFRNLLGGYVSTEQLQEVYGQSPETFNIIKNMVTVDTTLIDKININSADFRRFSRLPYFERQEINDLLKYRNENGQILNISELIENNILSEEKVVKVKPYLNFSQ